MKKLCILELAVEFAGSLNGQTKCMHGASEREREREEARFHFNEFIRTLPS